MQATQGATFRARADDNELRIVGQRCRFYQQADAFMAPMLADRNTEIWVDWNVNKAFWPNTWIHHIADTASVNFFEVLRRVPTVADNALWSCCPIQDVDGLKVNLPVRIANPVVIDFRIQVYIVRHLLALIFDIPRSANHAAAEAARAETRPSDVDQ